MSAALSELTAPRERAAADLPAALAEALRRAVGDEGLSTDASTRRLLSTDLSFRPAQTAAAVVRPRSVEQLAEAVQATTRAGYAVVQRGGGMSYTSGYTPERERSVLFDLRGLNRVLEINAEDT